MTPRQRQLARHALGLPNRRKRSYRNYFEAVYAPGGNFDVWAKMCAQDLADTTLGVSRSRIVHFWLTYKGTLAALDPDETLDPEDFPEALNTKG